MFNRDKFTQKLAKEIVQETNSALKGHESVNLKEFNEIKEILAHLHDKLNSLEKRLSTKELKDNTEYGHLQYKIGELQSDLKK